jgi:hypothetical protein
MHILRSERMFSTQSHSENLALLRAIVEAKFHSAPNDTDVPGSMILARLAARLRDALVAEEVRLEGASAAARWREWAAIGPERAEWLGALRCIHSPPASPQRAAAV